MVSVNKAENCPTCSAPISGGAKFCSYCGRSLGQQSTKSDFDIGRIAALDDVKKSVLTWVGGIGTILAIVGGYAIFGAVSTSVSNEITKKLDFLLAPRKCSSIN